MGKENEFTFQNDMINQLIANGWFLGKPEKYNRELLCILKICCILLKRRKISSGKNNASSTRPIPSKNFWSALPPN